MSKESSSPAKPNKVELQHPKYEDMIRDAIITLDERNGSIRQTIKKYILTTYNLPDNTNTNNRLRLAIHKGFDKGILFFSNGSCGPIKCVKEVPIKKEKLNGSKMERPNSFKNGPSGTKKEKEEPENKEKPRSFQN
ncbi:3136_t:CDS:2, partial [Funneliformis geosporum]